ncbi:MAG: DUF554 domain-containing protein [Erysipelotrichales bacterium]|nr:DUF554 domain-containing protein [Erysipelotrichales bacterium]
MIGLGTIINTAAVIVGGILGIILNKGITKRFETILMQANGLAVIFISISGVLSYMLEINEGGISTRGTMLLIFSLVFGSLIGEWIDIESKMEVLGVKVKDLVRVNNDNRFVDGFVTTSLIICVGAMAIVGPMQDGLTGDSSMLVVKAMLDFVIVVVLAATYGVGTIFSAIPLFIYQGSITLIAALFGSVISDVLIAEISFIGSALIFCVGANLIREKTFRVANMLPALFIPIFIKLLGF